MRKLGGNSLLIRLCLILLASDILKAKQSSTLCSEDDNYLSLILRGKNPKLENVYNSLGQEGYF